MEIKEPTYTIRYSPKALEDISYFKKSGDLAVKKKITKLLKEIELHPKTGTGKVEPLRFELTGLWSRRINNEHRIVYDIDEKQMVVNVFRLKGHY